MNRDPDNFWKAFDDTRRQVRAETIARERVLTLRHDMTAEQRKTIALQSLAESVATLRMVRDSTEIDADTLQEIDEAETYLTALVATLRHRLGNKTMLAKLAGMFGRPAP